MQIVYLIRKKNKDYFSIEKVFSEVSSYAALIHSVRIVHLPQKGVSILNILYAIFLRLRFRRNSVFHITGDAHYISLVMPRKKTLLTVHDSVFLRRYTGIKRIALRKLYLDWPLKWLKYVSVISEKTRLELESEAGNLRCEIFVINNPIQASFVRTEYEFNTACPRILFVGTNENKNLGRAVEALRGIRCKLVILGRLSKEQLAALEIGDTQFESYFSLSDLEVAELFSRIDILLFPSIYEGFGLPIIEAFAVGRPVITSDISPMNEVAGGAAVLVDPYDVASISKAVQRVIADKELRQEMVEAGFVVAKRYDGKSIAAKYLAIYSKMTSKIS